MGSCFLKLNLSWSSLRLQSVCRTSCLVSIHAKLKPVLFDERTVAYRTSTLNYLPAYVFVVVSLRHRHLLLMDALILNSVGDSRLSTSVVRVSSFLITLKIPLE